MITAEMVKELRTATGAGMMDCKNALVETGGNREKAITLLREKGLSKAAKKASRVAASGIVDAYIHLGGKVGVLVELNCETDFVAKTTEFKELARDICLQVAATNPSYLVRNDVPAEILDQEKDILRAQALREGKPEKIVDKIISGKIEKFYQENCLMEQSFIKDQDITIHKLVAEKIAKLGENMVVRRFARFEIGEAQAEGANC